MSINGYKCTALTGGAAGALDALDGAGLLNGDIAIVMASGLLYLFELDDDSGESESSPNVIAPDANAGTKRWKLQQQPVTNTVPVGAIMPFVGGYFSSGSNGGFTNVIGNDAATINALVGASGYRVCDGSALNLSGSAIYNGVGRYLPNLTDSRFLMGSSSAGSTGGANSDNHIHVFDHQHGISHYHTTGSFTLTTTEMPYHQHLEHAGVWMNAVAASGESTKFTPGVGSVYISEQLGASNPRGSYYTGDSGGGYAHNHGNTSDVSYGYSSSVSAVYGNANTGGPSATENRPAFLSCIYIQKVI